MSMAMMPFILTENCYLLMSLGLGGVHGHSLHLSAETAEIELIDSLENWRQSVGLDKFVLLGHSLGAFLACSYAMPKYPARVKHLILA